MSTPIVPINPGSSMAQIIAVINQNFAALGGSSVTTLYKDNTGTPRIIIGILPDGSTGLVISKPGIDVTKVFS